MKFLITIFLCFILFAAKAHEIRPAYLEIKENADKNIDIFWKQPVMGNYSLPLQPQISSGWMNDSSATKFYTETYLVKQWHVPAGHAPLDGQTINIKGLEKTITDALISITYLNGNTASYILKPAKPFLIVSGKQGNSIAVWSYLSLGIEHIWMGIDHLLFVLGLLLLVSGRRKLFITITTFTIAHSITLALATLKIIQVSSAFAEACIALSIVFLAVELARHYRGHDGITYKYPWMVAFIFGLMHGLGFAGALTSIGLPEQSIPMALLLFNVGVEIGQVVFVFAVLLVMWLVHGFIHSRRQMLRWIPVYAIGSMAAFWFIQRIIVLIGE